MRLHPLDAALSAVAVAPAAAAGYLGVLSVLSATPEPPRAGSATRFAVVVPAHDERANIAATVASLLALDYPRERFEVVVIADNCSDDTAAIAAAGGARVIERTDTVRRGKGYALGDVFPQVLADPEIDAVVVVDADTLVSPNLLGAVAARLEAGHDAVQVRYGVANADASWRTRLLRIAFAAFHDVRSLGRERLGVSTGLRGNGMSFSRRALELVPHDAFSVVEDLEYGIRLADAGIRVVYVHEADVRGEMPATGAASASQRQRWERGRAQMRRTHGPRLAARALRTRDPVAADLAADVLIPPLGQLGTVIAGGLLLSTAVHLLARRAPLARALWSGSAAALGGHVAAGWKRSGTGAAGLRDLAAAPAYVAWKLGSKAVRSTPDTWVRTTRAAETAPPAPQDTVGCGAAAPAGAACPVPEGVVPLRDAADEQMPHRSGADGDPVGSTHPTPTITPTAPIGPRPTTLSKVNTHD